MIDLSNNNGSVNFTTLRDTAGQYRVYLKLSEGANFADPTFIERYNAARKAGMRVGCYHYARPSENTPEGEAKFFARLAPQLEPGVSLRHCLDLEDPNIAPGPEVAIWAAQWAAHIYQLTGSKWRPDLYGSPGYLIPCEFTKAQASEFHSVWIASYGRNDGKEYPFTVPEPWNIGDVAAQQITDIARIPGCTGPVDLSRVFTNGLDIPKPHKLFKSKNITEPTWY